MVDFDKPKTTQQFFEEMVVEIRTNMAMQGVTLRDWERGNIIVETIWAMAMNLADTHAAYRADLIKRGLIDG